MKADLRKTKPLLHYGILVFMYALGIATIFSHTLLHALGSQTHNESHTTATCTSTHFHRYTMTFNATAVSPRSLAVKQCDEITVINNTGKEFELALGAHNHHAEYPGFTETRLEPGESYSFQATKSGTYPVHDHDNYELAGIIEVKE